MCGICGVVSCHSQVDQVAVDKMNYSLLHRGPDGEGKFNAPHLAFAMRRLSIIGLDDGWQPIYNEDHSLAVIANGELYNYVELRADLKRHGHHFSTHSDVEVILHLYEEHGVNCVKHLRGMFAFALWDEKNGRLLLARDRMGEKPLYIYEHDRDIYFASELKSLLRCGKIKFNLDPVAINLYFHYQYVPEPLTPIQGVRKLPAGVMLIIDVEPWQVEEHTYWSIEDIPPLEGNPIKLVRGQLEELSALLIRSDVPVGVALSGGVDSSAVAVLAAHAYPGVLQAFSVGYPGRPDHDERNQAKSLADSLKIPFHEVELSADEHTDFFDELVYLRDDPIADISGFGYYAVSRKARELGVPVLLQGQGGDELFWGYEWVRRAVAQTFRKQSRLKSGFWAAPDYLHITPPANFSRRTLWNWVKSGKGFSSFKEWKRDAERPKDEMIFINLISDFAMARRDLAGYYSQGFLSMLQSHAPEELFTFPHPWADIPVSITRLICSTYLSENGIAQGDRLSMANSVELRLPFVDYRLVETVIGLRRNYPDYKLPPKFWLKQALHGLLPNELLSQPKRGFAPPTKNWHSQAFERHGNKLIGGYLVECGILNPEAGKMLSSGDYPNEVVAPLSFKALVLELWARRMSNCVE